MMRLSLLIYLLNHLVLPMEAVDGGLCADHQILCNGKCITPLKMNRICDDNEDCPEGSGNVGDDLGIAFRCFDQTSMDQDHFTVNQQTTDNPRSEQQNTKEDHFKVDQQTTDNPRSEQRNTNEDHFIKALIIAWSVICAFPVLALIGIVVTVCVRKRKSRKHAEVPTTQKTQNYRESVYLSEDTV